MLSKLGGVSLIVVLVSIVSTQMLPDSEAFTINELEHLYFDDTGPQGFKSGIVPCTNYIDSSTAQPSNALGRQTSAQWIRTAFRKANFLQYSQV